MKSAGSILKFARNEKGISLQEASAVLKIPVKFLESLEESRFENFTSPTHLKGFLKSYCDFLNVEKDEVLAFFRREYNEEESKKRRPLSYRGQNIRFFHITPKTVTTAVVFILVSGFFSYIYWQYRSFASPPYLAIESPATDTATSSSSINVFLRADPNSEVSLNGQKLPPQANGSFALTVSLSKGINNLNFMAINKLSKASYVTRKVLADYQTPSLLGATTEAADQGLTMPGDFLKIDVEIVKDASYLTVVEDGKKSFEGIVLEGVKVSFAGDNEIKIKAGNAGVVKIIKNGEYLGVMGKEGEIIENIYTKSLK
jgi:cytoskeletal protein RodZ